MHERREMFRLLQTLGGHQHDFVLTLTQAGLACFLDRSSNGGVESQGGDLGHLQVLLLVLHQGNQR